MAEFWNAKIGPSKWTIFRRSPESWICNFWLESFKSLKDWSAFEYISMRLYLHTSWDKLVLLLFTKEKCDKFFGPKNSLSAHVFVLTEFLGTRVGFSTWLNLSFDDSPLYPYSNLTTHGLVHYGDSTPRGTKKRHLKLSLQINLRDSLIRDQ